MDLVRWDTCGHQRHVSLLLLLIFPKIFPANGNRKIPEQKENNIWGPPYFLKIVTTVELLYVGQFAWNAKLTTVCFVCAPNSSMWDTPLYGTVRQGLKVSHLSEFDCIGYEFL